jgi:hypothetical protein
MAWEKQLFDIPGLVTDVDLSGTTGTTSGYNSTGQFLFAKLTGAANVEPCAALTDFPVGVIQNNPKVASGYTNVGVQVRQLGVSKIVAAAAQSIGAIVGPNASGQAVARAVASGGGDATHWVAGILIDNAPGAAGQLGTYLLLSPFYLQA